MCDNCGNTFLLADAQEYRDGLYCQRCYERSSEVCTCCDDRFDPDGDGAWGGMCPDCAEEHFECESCREIYSRDDYGDDGMCQQCYDSEHGSIKNYHSGAACGIIFHPDKLETLYFGVELETDDYKDRERAAGSLSTINEDEELFWLESDCSLHNGIEIISQPCTLDYHRNHFPWREITDIVQKHGGHGEKTETAALHIHFSKDFFGKKHSELYQLRLIFLFEKFYDQLAILGRSTPYLLERSAKKYHRNLTNCSAKAKIKELRERGDRMQAVNITGRETIEIRICRSTLIAATILASLELVDFLIRLALKTNTKKLQIMTWADIIKLIKQGSYHYLPQYIDELGANK